MVYLDSSATTRVSDAAAKKMIEAATVIWGNPSSLHNVGLEAERLLTEARLRVLTALGVRNGKKENLVFSGSGTEANNLALFGVAHAKAHNHGKQIIITDSEHSSVRESARRLSEEGYRVCSLPTRGGVLDFEALEQALQYETVLISCMLVNNETGARYEVERAFAMTKRRYPNAVTHCDAVQGFLKVPFTPEKLGADLISVSSHKVHGPKGVGALYVSSPTLKAKRIVPLICGGGQESGLRSGTENIPGIAAFGEAVLAGFSADAALATRAYLLSHLPEEVTPNIPVGQYAPHIVSLSLPSIRSETMVHFLSSRGICVSSGSACASNAVSHGSAALAAFGLDAKRADSTIRVSFDDAVTTEEIDCFLAALREGIATLVRRN